MRNWILVGFLGLALTACGSGESTTTSASQAGMDASGAAKNEASAAQSAPAEPKHFYVMEENGEYGYESGISEDQQKAGQVAASISMVRYRGVIKGYHTLTSHKNGVTTTLRCKTPCEFAKLSNSMGGVSSDPETLRLAEGSLGWAMAQDAMNGQLKVYVKQ